MQRGGGERSDITGFSYQSHKRLMVFLNTIARDCPLPLFLTLTYPGEYVLDHTEWKRHLKNFAQWMRDRYPAASFCWKLEPQKRGAPHYHLMLWGLSFLPWQTLAVRWCEIVTGVDLNAPQSWSKGAAGCAEFRAFVEKVAITHPQIVDHLQAGTECRRVRSRNGVKCYAGKKYMGKEVEGMHGVGRFWGVHNRKALPRPKPLMESAPKPAVRVFARIARHFLRRQGYRARHAKSCDIFTERPDEWKRLFDLICAGRIGNLGEVRTRAQEEAIERAGRAARAAMCSLGAPVEKTAFLWD